MSYPPSPLAPQSALAPEQRGAAVARFCRARQEFYPAHRARHRGKPLQGKDHVASPCIHEGEEFSPEADWWEPGVEVLRPAVPPAA